MQCGGCVRAPANREQHTVTTLPVNLCLLPVAICQTHVPSALCGASPAQDGPWASHVAPEPQPGAVTCWVSMSTWASQEGGPAPCCTWVRFCHPTWCTMWDEVHWTGQARLAGAGATGRGCWVAAFWRCVVFGGTYTGSALILETPWFAIDPCQAARSLRAGLTAREGAHQHGHVRHQGGSQTNETGYSIQSQRLRVYASMMC
jgi:hypothetical protein